MADETNQSQSSAAVADVTATTPEASAPIVTTEAPAETAAPVAPPVPDVAPVEAAPAPEAPKPTLLGDQPKPQESKPDDAEKPIDGDAKPEEKPADEPPALPVYDEWALPEGVTADAEKIGAFNNLLGEFEIKTKADTAEVRALGQSLIDQHTAGVQEAVDRIGKTYAEIWQRTKQEWRSTVEAMPNGETLVNAAVELINTHGGTPQEVAEIKKFFDDTGTGNHPAMVRFLGNLNLAYSEGKPIPAAKPAPEKVGLLQGMYGGSKK